MEFTQVVFFVIKIIFYIILALIIGIGLGCVFNRYREFVMIDKITISRKRKNLIERKIDFDIKNRLKRTEEEIRKPLGRRK